MSRRIMMAVALGAAVVGNGAAALAQDGEGVFRRCQACHSLEAGQNKVGPSLNGVVGRHAGTVEGFRYSDLNHQAGELGLVWTKENIVEYLPDPQGFLESYIEANGGDPKGRTRMPRMPVQPPQAEAVVDYIGSHGE
ncbi:c-type cytochrome [Marivibrio halodurans]|uniref:C-type cytochrome n=1 Tax=Marivibrio halodurans TaxID=2039722 RepID=A0A8J7S8X8_9PROT|nr:c-type cytochrome [Marivibrio halodurans]MBP5859029.1 c-type cytochrome [Marivibrio halodurans]